MIGRILPRCEPSKRARAFEFARDLERTSETERHIVAISPALESVGYVEDDAALEKGPPARTADLWRRPRAVRVKCDRNTQPVLMRRHLQRAARRLQQRIEALRMDPRYRKQGLARASNPRGARPQAAQ